MRPQEFVNGFGEFGTDSGNTVGDLAGGGFADHRDGTEGLQEGISADLAQSGDLIEQGFGDPFESELTVVGDGEAVCLVAQGLQDLQGGTVPVQDDRLAAAGEKDLLVPLRQTDDRKRRTVDGDQRVERQMQLSFSAVPPSGDREADAVRGADGRSSV